MTKDITIAGVNIPSRFFLAPLAGYTDYAFRTLAREYGVGLVYTEMVSAAALSRGIKPSYRYIKIAENDKPIAIQLFGGKPDEFAKSVSENNLSGFSFVDINMGCPVRKVLKTGGGSALLADTNKMREVIEAVRQNTSIPVSVKIRLGQKPSDGGVLERALAVEDAGAAFIAVHGRYTVDKFEQGTMKIEPIAKIKEALKIPVVGNGDVLSVYDAKTFFKETGVDAIMIGRGAIGAPWLFSELNSVFGDEYRSPSKEEIKSVIVSHVKEASKIYGEESGIRFMRKFLIRYLKSLSLGKQERLVFMRYSTEKEVCDAVMEL